MNWPIPPPRGMLNLTVNPNLNFNSNPNFSYSQGPFSTQFPQIQFPSNHSPNLQGSVNTQFSRVPSNPNPNASEPFAPSHPNPFFNNNNYNNAIPFNPAVPSGFSTRNDSFTFAPQNNVQTLDLEETIRFFKQLISHAETTAKQISDLVKLNPSDCSKDLSVCPFDSCHRMPPEHVFRHSLSCPSSPGVLDLNILSTVRYPHTLKSNKDLSAQSQIHLFKPLPGSGSDLCISIEEEEGVVDSDLFYKDAPGVVNSTQREIRKTFTLPSILSKECVDSGNENAWPSADCDVILLPSEFWALNSELAKWNDFPSRYSFVALETAMGLGKIKESEIVYWMILNSPAYGIIIDLPMARHIVLLLKLCLKAVAQEAFGIYRREIGRNDVAHESNMDTDTSIKTLNKVQIPRTTYFDCQVLLESMVWLASEMSALYGQACGKKVVVSMLRHSFVCGGKALTYPLKDKEQAIAKISRDLTEATSVVDVSDGKANASAVEEETNNASEERNLSRSSCDRTSDVRNRHTCERGDGLILNSRVFVSQVAAAVAALQERLLLEDRIRGLRHSRRLSKFQLLSEHDNAVKKAAEERERRVDYKPILEHDGLVWQRSSGQDSRKHKTREELLAEERDYKRRRMSYRGKKIKRTPTRVLHDIIEAHMEEIKVAGGIGCFVKGVSETPQIATESIPSDGVVGSRQEFRSTDSFLSNKGEGLSFRSNLQMQLDGVSVSSKRLDVGKMDLQTTRFSRPRSPHVSSRNYFDDNSKLDKHEHHKKSDYAQDDGNGEHSSTKLFHDEDASRYSGYVSEKMFMRGYESKHDTHYKKLDIHRHEEINSESHNKHESRHRSRSSERKHKSRRRSRSCESKHKSRRRSSSRESKHKSRHRSSSQESKHESRHTSLSRESKHESRHRSRSHERKDGVSNDRYDTGGSSERHRYASYDNAHRSKEHSQESRHYR